MLSGTAKVKDETRDETPSKKQRKEKKKNRGNEYGADAGQIVEETREESGVSDINDLLFKQSHQSGEAFVFDSAELFKEPEVALSICDSP